MKAQRLFLLMLCSLSLTGCLYPSQAGRTIQRVSKSPQLLQSLQRDINVIVENPSRLKNPGQLSASIREFRKTNSVSYPSLSTSSSESLRKKLLTPRTTNHLLSYAAFTREVQAVDSNANPKYEVEYLSYVGAWADDKQQQISHQRVITGGVVTGTGGVVGVGITASGDRKDNNGDRKDNKHKGKVDLKPRTSEDVWNY